MRKESQVKSRLRPDSILFNAYPPERYKIESGSKRKVFVRFGIEKIGINKFEFYTVLFLGKATKRVRLQEDLVFIQPLGSLNAFDLPRQSSIEYSLNEYSFLE